MSHPRNGITNKSPKQPTSPVSTRPKKMASQTKAQSNQRHLCQHDPRNGITNKRKATNVCQQEKWSRPHPRPSTPFGSTLQTTCHPRSRHTERPRCEVKSSMSIARVGCGNFAWSMCTNPSNLVNTDIPSQKNQFCVPIYRQSGDQTLRLPCRTHAVARNGLKSPSAVPFPSNFHTSKREIVENGWSPQSSSRSRTSQSNTWCVAAFRAAGTKARSSKCEPSIRPRTCRHISLCRNMSKS